MSTEERLKRLVTQLLEELQPLVLDRANSSLGVLEAEAWSLGCEVPGRSRQPSRLVAHCPCEE
jgi:hypothetical protein